MSKSKAARLEAATELMKGLPKLALDALAFKAGAKEFGEIADRLGRIAAMKAELKTYEEGLKDVLIELGEDAVEGELFRATVSSFPQTKLDTDAIRAEMDEDWIAAHSMTQRITQVRTKARTGALANVAA